jgi:hypothetical protein
VTPASVKATRIAPDHLRPPAPLDPLAAGYKDWLHVNVFDHASGLVGIVNVSLDGSPEAPESRAVGTALIEVPGVGWRGNLAIRPLTDARVGIDSIALDAVAIRIDTTSGLVSASARLPRDGLRIDATGSARAVAMVPDRTVAFGSGWLGWYAVPRLAMSGSIRAGERVFPLAEASGYVDHSWGRWHWGEDIGWEWGSFLTRAPGPEFVLSRVTDRLHVHTSGTSLEVRLGSRRRPFSADAVELTWSGLLAARPRRLPGALAVLHVDRARPKLSSNLTIRADDGHDRVRLEFTARSAAQLIVADSSQRGYSFLHEIVGSFTCSGKIGGKTFEDDGLAVVERVE